jgi:hypothetical protein
LGADDKQINEPIGVWISTGQKEHVKNDLPEIRRKDGFKEREEKKDTDLLRLENWPAP